MLSYVTEGIETVIEWLAIVIGQVFGPDTSLSMLAPLFAIGISISAILLGVKLIKSMVWGS